jgi:hypothetical protein
MDLKRPLLLGLVALLVGAPVADARSPFHAIGKGTVWTDGERYAVIEPASNFLDAFQVRDDVTGERWQISRPHGSAFCYLVSVANRNVLWQCGDTPALQELGSGAIRPVPGWATYRLWLDSQLGASPSEVGPRDFGDRWLEAGESCYHCGVDLHYIDWQSGTFVSAASELPERTVDLDRPDFDVPLCAPLARAPVKEREGSAPFLDSQYERPWFLRRVFAPGPRVKLYHCGRREPILIARCRRGDCQSRQLGGGHLTWRDGYRVYTFNLRTRKRTLAGIAPASLNAPSVAHTRRTVYVAGSGKVYAARLR